MSVTTISRQCGQGDHGFCRVDATTCNCSHCHLGPCAECGAGNLQKMYGSDDRKLCARCYSAELKAQPPAATRCDTCGRPGAYRNPGHRRNEYLCNDCHAASGEPVILTGSVAHLAQPCAGADIADERHVWVHIRGTRFHCLCGADRYDPKMREQHRRELYRAIGEDTV